MKAAEYFLNTAKHAGFKRTGIISVKERPVVELTSSEQIIVPLVNDGVILIDNEHLTTITSLANYSMERNRAKLKKLLHNLQSQ